MTFPLFSDHILHSNYSNSSFPAHSVHPTFPLFYPFIQSICEHTYLALLSSYTWKKSSSRLAPFSPWLLVSSSSSPCSQLFQNIPPRCIFCKIPNASLRFCLFTPNYPHMSAFVSYSFYTEYPKHISPTLISEALLFQTSLPFLCRRAKKKEIENKIHNLCMRVHIQIGKVTYFLENYIVKRIGSLGLRLLSPRENTCLGSVS